MLFVKPKIFFAKMIPLATF